MATNGSPNGSAPTSSATVLDALGDPTRRAILELLKEGSKSVQELADRLPVTRPAVSQHLRVLSDARLVSHERAGTRHIYALQRDGLEDLREYLDVFWREALAGIKAVAEMEEQERRTQ